MRLDNLPDVAVKQVKGFLSEEQQATVLAEAEGLGWLDDPSTQNQVEMAAPAALNM